MREGEKLTRQREQPAQAVAKCVIGRARYVPVFDWLSDTVPVADWLWWCRGPTGVSSSGQGEDSRPGSDQSAYFLRQRNWTEAAWMALRTRHVTCVHPGSHVTRQRNFFLIQCGGSTLTQYRIPCAGQVLRRKTTTTKRLLVPLTVFSLSPRRFWIDRGDFCNSTSSLRNSFCLPRME